MTVERVLREVSSTFLGSPRTPRRARPHRCIDCGRVTRHVRCHACSGATSCVVCSWQSPLTPKEQSE